MVSDMVPARVLALLGCAVAVSGCVGPTYGTGRTQGEQLVSDLDNIVSFGSVNKTRINYAPRPELVKPKSIGALPPPREAVVDPNLPESPELRRARLAAAAPDGSDDALPVSFTTAAKDGMAPEQATARSRVGSERELENSWLSAKDMSSQRAAAQERSSIGRQGSPTQRRYLSEPPLTYRAPASTAPVGDQGIDEEVKERKAKGTTSLGSKLRSVLPF